MTTAPPDWFFVGCPPGAEKMHPEFTELLVAFAHAMWEWSRIEASLFLIFADAIEPNRNKLSKPLRAAFFSVVSPRGRIDMVHSVARAVWTGKPHWNAWVSLRNECCKQLGRRGRYAHLIGYGYKEDQTAKAMTVVLGEPIHHPDSPKGRKHLKSRGVTLDEVLASARDWKELGDRLELFRALANELAQPEASAELISCLFQSLGSPVGQSHKAPPSPRKSSRS